MRVPILAAGLAAAACAVTGCSSSTNSEITVFAAASLKVPFIELAQQYEQDHPGTTVTFNFAGSSDLVAQLQQGASSDILATADEATMDNAAADGLTDSPTLFASNSMMIAVPLDNPGNVKSLASLADPGLRVVLCAPQVPCGAATQRVIRGSGVTIGPDSEESAATDVLNKVSTGEADAGIVYISDAATAGESVRGIDIPTEHNATNLYPIATVAGTDSGLAASEFVDLVTGPRGQRILEDAGFGSAP